MTHEERIAKIAAAMKAAIPEGEECAVMAIVASQGTNQMSVVCNLSNEGRMEFLKLALRRYECGDMKREPPKNIQ